MENETVSPSYNLKLAQEEQRMPPRKFVFLFCCVVFGSVAINHLFSTGNNIAAAQARIVRVAAANGPIGGTINVPIEIVSQGDENAVGFSLTFDAAVLGNPQVSLGSDASGATINSNAGQAAQGRFGVALAFPASQSFAAGVRQMAVVTFSVAANADFGTTNLGFADQPVVREVADTTANALTTTFTGGAVTLTKGFEADVSPRPDGDNNGTVTVTDWTQIGLFVAGIDTPAPGNEFQRADCAPRTGLGDGKITIIDWTQAGRYAAGLDPATPAGGPTMPADSSLAGSGKWPAASGRSHFSQENSSAPTIRLKNLPTPDSRFPTALSIEIEARGNENAMGFSLVFNASHWRLLDVSAGRDAREVSLHINSSQTERGQIGIAMALPVGRTFAAGTRQLIVCRFAPITTRKGLPLAIKFGDLPIAREIADVEANPVAALFSAEEKEFGELTNVSAASFVGNVFAPGQMVTAFGTNLATTTATSTSLPDQLGGTQVSILDSVGIERFAPLLFVSERQINYLMPEDLAEGAATVIVTNAAATISKELIEIARVAPGLFSANADGKGLAAAVALRVKADNSQQFESIARFDQLQRRFLDEPLRRASDDEELYLILFGTGFRHAVSVRAELNGQPVEVVYAGRQGNASELAGLDQINLRLPKNLRLSGDVVLNVIVDGHRANSLNIRMR